MTTPYAIWFTLTVAVILITWRRDVVRERNATRARDRARHPSQADVVRTVRLYAAVPELKSMPVSESAPLVAEWGDTLDEIHALPVYRGGRP